MFRIGILTIIFVLGASSLVQAEIYQGESYFLTDSSPLMEPDEQNGVVCFLREKASKGRASEYAIYEGQKLLGPLYPGSYFCRKVPAKRRYYSARTTYVTSLDFEVEAGKKYYVLAGLTGKTSVPSLSRITPSYAKNIIPGLKLVQKGVNETDSSSKSSVVNRDFVPDDGKHRPYPSVVEDIRNKPGKNRPAQTNNREDFEPDDGKHKSYPSVLEDIKNKPRASSDYKAPENDPPKYNKGRWDRNSGILEDMRKRK